MESIRHLVLYFVLSFYSLFAFRSTCTAQSTIINTICGGVKRIMKQYSTKLEGSGNNQIAKK